MDKRIWITAGLLIAFSRTLSAQEVGDTDTAQAVSTTISDTDTALVSTPEAAPAVSRAEFEQLKADLAEQKKQLSDIEAEKQAHEEQEMIEEEFEPSLDIYGFMAVYGGQWIVEEDNPLYGVMNTHFSFGVTDLNVYFSARLTETLSSLVELRFSFMPNGADQFPEMARINTEVTNPVTTETTVLGGLVVERAMFTWQPRDWIGISAGRYLTPFGIWNEDHGAPVVIPVNQPYLILRHTIPLAQTGLMLHGNVFPSESIVGKYAVTFSNGRGPVESTFDLDNNKAVGLRLRLGYEKNSDVEISVGGYGYIGQYTNDTKVLDTASLGIDRTVTNKYWEYSVSADLLIQLYGFRLQSEWASGLIDYVVRPPATIPILNVETMGQWQSDHTRWDAYVLLAYEWSFTTKKNHSMKLTPFVMGEWDVMFDNIENYDTWLLRYGLNFKPHYLFTAKFDITHVTFPGSDILSNMTGISAQAAVSF